MYRKTIGDDFRRKTNERRQNMNNVEKANGDDCAILCNGVNYKRN